jgi:CheY-like chemotaxis protein
MNFMIVEDDKMNQAFLRRFLEPCGKCDLALNGSEAVDLFKPVLKTKLFEELQKLGMSCFHAETS